MNCWRKVERAKFFWSAHAAIAEIAETGKLALQRVATNATIADDWTASRSHRPAAIRQCRGARRSDGGMADSMKARGKAKEERNGLDVLLTQRYTVAPMTR
jgi:hypothetical protein